MPIIKRTATTYNWQDPQTGQEWQDIPNDVDPSILEQQAASQRAEGQGGGLGGTILSLALAALPGGLGLLGKAARALGGAAKVGEVAGAGAEELASTTAAKEAAEQAVAKSTPEAASAGGSGGAGPPPEGGDEMAAQSAARSAIEETGKPEGPGLLNLALRAALAGGLSGFMQSPGPYGDPVTERLLHSLGQAAAGFALPLTLGGVSRLAAPELSSEEALRRATGQLASMDGDLPESTKAGPGGLIQLTTGEASQNPKYLEGERVSRADPRFQDYWQQFDQARYQNYKDAMDLLTTPGSDEAIQKLDDQRKAITPDKGLYAAIDAGGLDIQSLRDKIAQLTKLPQTGATRGILGWTANELERPEMQTARGVHLIYQQLGDALTSKFPVDSPLANARNARPVVTELMGNIADAMDAPVEGRWTADFRNPYSALSQQIERGQALRGFSDRLDLLTPKGQMPTLQRTRSLAAQFGVGDDANVASLIDALDKMRGISLVTARKLPGGGSQTWAQLGAGGSPFARGIQGLAESVGSIANPLYGTTLQAIGMPWEARAQQTQAALNYLLMNPDELRQRLQAGALRG